MCCVSTAILYCMQQESYNTQFIVSSLLTGDKEGSKETATVMGDKDSGERERIGEGELTSPYFFCLWLLLSPWGTPVTSSVHRESEMVDVVPVVGSMAVLE